MSHRMNTNHRGTRDTAWARNRYPVCRCHRCHRPPLVTRYEDWLGRASTVVDAWPYPIAWPLLVLLDLAGRWCPHSCTLDGFVDGYRFCLTCTRTIPTGKS